MSNYSDFLAGLIAAPHTPMREDCSLNIPMIAKQAARLTADGVRGAFICGSTGESHSLTVAERMQIAEAWKQAIGPGPLKLIVHVGHNCLEDAKVLATHARRIGADAVAAPSPCYFKPATVDDLVDFCVPIAASAPDLPFYYYDIPSLTGVNLPMVDFLRKAQARIPNLAGLKFSHPNLMSLQQCLQADDGRFNILFGCDEMLLAVLALGVRGAVGSTYNFAAPLYHKIIAAQQAGDLAAAQALQMRSVKLVEVLLRFGVLAAGKVVMRLVGADCGPVRPPLHRLSGEQITRLLQLVEALGVVECKADAMAGR